VKPAPAGTIPGHQRVQENKAKLMRVLGPKGITNDRLDEVSDYYRYNRRFEKLWRTRPASIYAVVDEGDVIGFKIIDGGAGYTTSPSVSIPGVNTFNATVNLSFGTDLSTNGAVTAVSINQDQ